MSNSSTGESCPPFLLLELCLFVSIIYILYFLLRAKIFFHIMMQVHDELVLEVDPCYVKEAAMLLQSSMENAVSLLGIPHIPYSFFWNEYIYKLLYCWLDWLCCVFSVPLHVKLKVGKTWGSLEPLQGWLRHQQILNVFKSQFESFRLFEQLAHMPYLMSQNVPTSTAWHKADALFQSSLCLKMKVEKNGHSKENFRKLCSEGSPYQI